MATIQDFEQLDIRTGTITACEPFPQARKPAYKLTIDFGPDVGVRHSSAQITASTRQDSLSGARWWASSTFPAVSWRGSGQKCWSSAFTPPRVWC